MLATSYPKAIYTIFDSVGLVVKGLDNAVINMHVGDRYKLTFGGDYAFPAGRGSSAGIYIYMYIYIYTYI
jgi:FKBP-type peptidyl-prolyl cis-trans isomerase 2